MYFFVFFVIDFFLGKHITLNSNKIIIIVSAGIFLLLTWFIIAPIIIKSIFDNAHDDIVKNTARDLLQVLQFKYKTLGKSMWVMPDNMLHFLFGTGHLVNGTVSTVGYVNNIWAFGIIGSLILYLMVTKIYIIQMHKNRENPQIYKILLSSLLVFFVIQLKMPVFRFSAGGLLQFSIPLWVCILKKNSTNTVASISKIDA